MIILLRPLLWYTPPGDFYDTLNKKRPEPYRLGSPLTRGHSGLADKKLSWRRGRDSNPGYLAVYPLSKRTH